ncbi:unnamed protein product [Soboliphyme baturini]|uniref:BRCT domain-containing protein n=1 Tax=Soboliphyme baturini TaxID=241478 RepID=A0A183IY32_9BILA|nr:unnamed protein product [Soboliphyme baturini]
MDPFSGELNDANLHSISCRVARANIGGLLEPVDELSQAKPESLPQEESYEWSAPSILSDSTLVQKRLALELAKASGRWRRRVFETGKKAYDGWKVLLLADRTRENSLKRLLEVGGAEVSLQRTNAGSLTHVLIDIQKRPDARVYVS